MSDTAIVDGGLSPLLVDADTAAASLGGVSRGTLRNLVIRGDLPAVKVGRRLMFRREDLSAYVARLPAAADVWGSEDTETP